MILKRANHYSIKITVPNSEIRHKLEKGEWMNSKYTKRNSYRQTALEITTTLSIYAWEISWLKAFLVSSNYLLITLLFNYGIGLLKILWEERK